MHDAALRQGRNPARLTYRAVVKGARLDGQHAGWAAGSKMASAAAVCGLKQHETQGQAGATCYSSCGCERTMQPLNVQPDSKALAFLSTNTAPPGHKLPPLTDITQRPQCI